LILYYDNELRPRGELQMVKTKEKGNFSSKKTKKSPGDGAGTIKPSAKKRPLKGSKLLITIVISALLIIILSASIYILAIQ